MIRRGRKTFGLNLLLCFAFVLPAWVGAQENVVTPSQRTKEAVEKFSKTPALIGESLETLKKAGRARLEETFGAKPAPKPEPDVTSLPVKKGDEAERPRYSPLGKRDPFRPFSLRTKAGPRPRESLSPLERFELGQLKLVGIVWDIKEPRAMIEDTGGLGYIVKVGTAIGANEGKIKTILPNEIIVEEIYSDFYGARKKREVSLRLLVE